MSDFREEEKLGKLYDTHLTRRLMKYLWPYRWMVVVAVSMTMGVAAMGIVGPYLFGHVAVDGFIVPATVHSISAHTALIGILWVVVAYLGSLVANFGLQYAQVRIMQSVGQKTMYDLRKEIFEHLQRLPISFFDRSPVGRLVTRATTDVDALNDLFASGVVAMLNDFVQLFRLGHIPIGLEAGSGARNSLASSLHDRAHLLLSQQCPRGKPRNPNRNRPDQWISSRAHQRHGNRAAFQS